MTFPAIFSMAVWSESRALKVITFPNCHARLLKRTSTPPLSGCQSLVMGAFFAFHVRAMSSLQRNVGGFAPSTSMAKTIQPPLAPS